MKENQKIPESIESEMCVLSAMLLEPTMIDPVREIIAADDFHQVDHSIIFESICRVWDRADNGKQTCDTMLVREDLISRKLLEEMGGVAYLGEVLKSAPSAYNALQYAKVVKEKSIRRTILRAADDVIKRIVDTIEPSELIRQFESTVADKVESGGGEIKHLSQFIDNVFTEGKAGANKLLPSGWKSLDHALGGGLMFGDYVILAARPSMGKSLVAKCMAKNLAMAGIDVGYISVEESGRKIARNLLAAESGVFNSKVRTWQLGQEEYQEIEKAAGRMGTIPYWICDSEYSIDPIIQKVRRLVRKHGCKVIFVDHLHDISSSGKEENETIRLQEISRAFKNEFKRLGVVGIVCCQLNRQLSSREEKRPHLTDLRQSGAIEQQADTVIMLHREDYYYQDQIEAGLRSPTEEIEFLIRKNRDDALRVAVMHFDGPRQNIREREASNVPY